MPIACVEEQLSFTVTSYEFACSVKVTLSGEELIGIHAMNLGANVAAATTTPAKAISILRHLPEVDHVAPCSDLVTGFPCLAAVRESHRVATTK